MVRSAGRGQDGARERRAAGVEGVFGIARPGGLRVVGTAGLSGTARRAVGEVGVPVTPGRLAPTGPRPVRPGSAAPHRGAPERPPVLRRGAVVETAPQAAGRRVLDRPEDAREVRSCLVAASPGPPVRSADVGVGAPRSGGRRVVRVGSGAVVRPSAGRRPVAVRRDAVRRAAAATLVGAVSLLMVVVLGLLADAAGSGNARSTVPAGTAVVRTQPGDTAWVLARREVPGADAAAVVERIVADNGLAGPDGGVLPGGLTVRVPR